MVKKLFYILLILFLVTVYIYFFCFGGDQYLQLSSIQSWKDKIKSFYLISPIVITTIYFIFYIMVTSIGLPGAVVLTLFGGFLFGLVKGTILASFASSIGALMAFLLTRFFFFSFKTSSGNTMTSEGGRKYSRIKIIETIQDRIKTEGAWYLFTLRLIPLFPFFIINIAMGFTPIKARTFFWISQLGMLPATILYVNAGVQLSEIETLKDIMSFPVIISFTLLGLFPIVVKIIFKRIRRK